MTAARVINPVMMRASPAMGRQPLNHIKRNLFGATNTVETKQLFVEEQEKHQEKAAMKWGFDFRAGMPLNANSQFMWERVKLPETSYGSEMYMLTRAAHLRPSAGVAPLPSAYELRLDERADRENFTTSMLTSPSSLSATDESGDDSMDEGISSNASSTVAMFKVPADILGTVSRTMPLRKRQPKITEYMKERKRLSQTPKKLSPAKRMRSSSPGSSSSAPMHIQHCISTAFSIRKVQRNN